MMPNANQDSRCAARIVLCAALSLGFVISAARAESDLKKVCKVGMTLSSLEPDGDAMNCRALPFKQKPSAIKLAAKAQKLMMRSCSPRR